MFSTQSDNCIPNVHIFDIISFFAIELEEPKIGISGKGLKKNMYDHLKYAKQNNEYERRHHLYLLTLDHPIQVYLFQSQTQLIYSYTASNKSLPDSCYCEKRTKK